MAALGNPLGQVILSRWYIVGEGAPIDQQRGFALAELSAQQGCPLGMKNLVNCKLVGSGCKKNEECGIEPQKRAASAGCVVARENVMRSTERGNYGFTGGKRALMSERFVF